MTPLLAILLSTLDLCAEPPSGVPELPRTERPNRWRGTWRAIGKDKIPRRYFRHFR